MGGNLRVPDEIFAPAAAGTRVRAMTGGAVLLLVVLVAVQAAVMPRHAMADYWIGVGAPRVAAPIMAAVWWCSRIHAYRLSGERLIIERPVSPVEFSLEGLESIAADRSPMRGARRRCGNDGLGAVSGRFRSNRLGEFRAYLTDSEHGVVLRAAAGTFVISPAQPEVLIDAVRRRIQGG